jgi:ribonucleoside-diphosphate reductase alpha chain
MGLGITGLANTAEILGLPYGDPEMLTFMEDVLTILRDTAYMSSISLAIEKGPFEELTPGYIGDYESFAGNLPKEIQEEIAKHGIRNSHLLSIAPTGTISLAAGNVSSGIEPPYTTGVYTRRVYQSDGSVRSFELVDFAEAKYGVIGVTSEECSVEDHVNVLCLASKFVDSSVSKTCNVGPEVSFLEFKDVYSAAYRRGASGITTFRPAEYGGKREGILQKPKGLSPLFSVPDGRLWAETEKATPTEDGAACFIDDQGNRSCD